MNIYIYIAVMALTTYLIRMLPMVALRRDIKNKYIKAFLKFIPASCLTAMTIPAIFFSTQWVISGIAAFLTAVILSICKKNLVTVAAGSCITVFLVELILGML